MRNRSLVLFLAFAALAAGSRLYAAELGAPSGFSNSEPNYVALRQLELEESFDVSDLRLGRDVGVLRLNGKIAFGKEVLGRRVLGVFTGSGTFVLESSLPWERHNLEMYVGETSVTEDFTAAVIWFTDDSYREIAAAGIAGVVDPQAAGELERVRSGLRKRNEKPQSSLEAMLTADDIDNVEAFVLSDLMSGNPAGEFMAYMKGQRYQDLRYFVRPRGALPQMLSSEEVALVNYDPGAEREGVWYLAHRAEEYRQGRAVDHRVHEVDAQHYEIETTIAKNREIEGKAKIRFRGGSSGARVISLGLLPELRVSSARLAEQELPFIQEDRRRDGSLFVVMPEPVGEGQEYELELTYAGEDVIKSEGGGNYSVGARTSWYPNFGAFADRASFDLTFRYPKENELVSVGSLVQEPQKDKNTITAHWRSETPLAVAGFNYGESLLSG